MSCRQILCQMVCFPTSFRDRFNCICRHWLRIMLPSVNLRSQLWWTMVKRDLFAVVLSSIFSVVRSIVLCSVISETNFSGYCDIIIDMYNTVREMVPLLSFSEQADTLQMCLFKRLLSGFLVQFIIRFTARGVFCNSFQCC